MAEELRDNNGFELFGFSISRKKKATQTQKAEVQSFVPPEDETGATVDAAGHYGYQVELDPTQVRSDRELILKYRDAASTIECDSAIEDIVNEAIVSDTDSAPVSLILDDLKATDRLEKVLREEFEEIVRLLDFNNKAHDIFRRWYIDGRVYFHVIANKDHPKNGILEVRPIDASQIKKVRKVKKEHDNSKNIELVTGVEEYFVYQDASLKNMESGLKIHPDSIVHVTSGILDPSRKFVQSYLHKALRAVNQLRMMEDSLVIYRLARAPERRIFYIDVGNLPKGKAEEYVSKIMTKHRNKLVYDASTGAIKNENKQMNMLEDFWLPRREGGRGTEIDTLPGGDNLGQIEDILYFKKKLYQSLNVPMDRLEQETPFSMGRAQEITRDEIKFQKFIARLRMKFARLFTELLRKQLILKGLVTEDEWSDIVQDIKVDFLRDTHYMELKDAELLRDRLNVLEEIDPYIGRFYSEEWVRKKVLMQTDEDIELIDKQIKQNGDDEEYEENKMFERGIHPEQQPPVEEPVEEPKPEPTKPEPKEEKSEPEDKNKEDKDKKRQEQREELELQLMQKILND